MERCNGNEPLEDPLLPLTAAAATTPDRSHIDMDRRTDGIRAQIEQEERLLSATGEEDDGSEAAPTESDTAHCNGDATLPEPHDDVDAGCCSEGCCVPPSAGFWGAVVNLCSATLGAGVLSLPHACAQGGWIVSGLLLLVAAWATCASIQLLVRACTFYQLYTYESLTAVLYGRRLRALVEACIVLFCQGCAVAYLIAVADILEQAHLLLMGSRAVSMAAIWTCVLLPLSSLRTMTALQMSSAVGIAAIGTLVFATLVHWYDDTIYDAESDNNETESAGWEVDGFLFFDQRNSTNQTSSTSSTSALWPQQGWFSVLTTCPIILFAFSCQVNVCAIYEELPMPSRRRNRQIAELTLASERMKQKQNFMQSVAVVAVVICATLYVTISVASVADLGVAGVTPNILNAYPQRVGIMQVVAAGMVLAVTMAFPLNIFPARVTLQGLWQECSPPRPPLSEEEDTSCSLCCCSRRRRQRQQQRLPNSALTAALLEDDEGGGGETSDDVDREAPPSNQRDSFGQEDVENRPSSGQAPAPAAPDSENNAAFPLFRHVVLTLVLAGSALGVALVAPNISIVFQIIGGTASSVLGFCVPGLLGLRLGRDVNDGTNGQLICTSWLLLYGGAVVGILTTAVTIYQIIQES